MYIRSSKNRNNRTRRIVAEEELPQDPQMEEGGAEGAVEVDPEATELVFETEDVAELIAEVTGQDVDVVADENEVTFTVGDTDYTVEAEGQEEILESTSLKGRKSVKANTRKPAGRRPVAASTRSAAPATQRRTNTPAGRVIRKVGNR